MDARADVEASDHRDITCLWAAAEFGKDDLCTYLLDKGACLHKIDKVFGHTPFIRAAVSPHSGHVDVVTTLKNAQADIWSLAKRLT